MKAAILALIVVGLMLAGVASAVDPIVPLNTWLTWAQNNLTTPAYSSGWGFAFANATSIDPCTGACIDKFQPIHGDCGHNFSRHGGYQHKE